MTVVSPIICDVHHPERQDKETLMKKSLSIDSEEPLIKEIFGRSTGRCSDQELHNLLQDLIDSDHRLLIEIKLLAWHEAYLLNKEGEI